MAMLDEWKALSARIEGLVAVAQLAISAHATMASGGTMLSEIKKQAGDIYGKLNTFVETFAPDLPIACKGAIQAQVQTGVAPPYTGGFDALAIGSIVTPLMTLSAEVTHMLTDTQQVVARKSERAFLHLRRCVEANENVRRDWIAAFDRGEPACERLGAAHLLLHGIYGFKVNAEHARTDLVINEPIDLNEVGRTAEGLVLTEWKTAQDVNEAETKATQARAQCRGYIPALGGLELRPYRYIVLVSKQFILTPKDVQADGVVYRHINIPVDPETPSVSARRSQGL